MRASCAACSRAIATVSSVEPSSTTTTSRSWKVWAATLSSVSRRNAPPLWVGTQTLTRGAGIALPSVAPEEADAQVTLQQKTDGPILRDRSAHFAAARRKLQLT